MSKLTQIGKSTPLQHFQMFRFADIATFAMKGSDTFPYVWKSLFFIRYYILHILFCSFYVKCFTQIQK